MVSELAVNGGTPVRTKSLGVAWPEYDEREIEAVTEVIHSRQWGGTPGTVVREFEQERAAFCGAKYAICLTNSTTQSCRCRSSRTSVITKT